MLQAGIETWLTLRQPDNIPHSYEQSQRKRRNFNVYVIILIVSYFLYNLHG